MGNWFKFAIFALGVFTAYYFRRKSRGLQYEQRQSLFDAELTGTVEMYPHNKRLEEIRPGVWVAFDYALANVLIVERHSEWVVIDTTENCQVMEQIIEDLIEKIGKPTKIAAMIYTHFHTDHTAGGGAVLRLASEIKQDLSTLRIIAHEKFRSEYEKFTHLSKNAYPRATGQFGQMLEIDQQINAGIGHRLAYHGHSVCAILPTEAFEESIDLMFHDLTVKIFHAPGETEDQIAVYIKELKLLCPADDIYPHFPNIYPIRGAPARSAIQWANTIKMFSKMEIDTMMGCHGPVVHGAEAVQDILNIYHDGIKYVHDQTIRGMEKLLSLDDIVDGAKLPKTLAEHPWLKQTYGTVEWASRGVYNTYIGWFDGQAKNLRPLKQTEKAKRIVNLAGGPVNVANAIRNQQQNSISCLGDINCIQNELQWGLELTQSLIDCNCIDFSSRLAVSSFLPDSMNEDSIKTTKVFILEEMAKVQTNPTARNWYLQEANALKTGITPFVDIVTRNVAIRNIGADIVMRSFESRINSIEAMLNWEGKTILFVIQGEEFHYFIRNGVMTRSMEPLNGHFVGLIASDHHFKDILGDPISALSNYMKGEYEVIGSTVDLVKFFSLFK